MADKVNILTALPGFVALLALAYTIYKDYSLRREEAYLKAISGLSNGAPAVRIANIQALQSFILKMPLKIRERQENIVRVLSGHLITEQDSHVRDECSRAISRSSSQIKLEAIKCLYELNQTLWDDRNQWYRQDDDREERYHDKLKIINKTIAMLLQYNYSQTIDLRGIHLDFSNLSNVNLSNCNLTEATLTHVNFSKARLENTIFDRALIIDSYLSGNSLKGSSFNDALICNCHFERLTNHEGLNKAKFLFGNKCKETKPLSNEIHEAGWIREVFLTKELDWLEFGFQAENRRTSWTQNGVPLI